MAKPAHSREAHNAALQFERLVCRILDRITATNRGEAEELAEYTNQLLRCLRRSNNVVGTKRGQQQSIQAAVWMVEVLIVLETLKDRNAERALITAAIEVLERIEAALRAEGSLPPVRD